MKKTVTIIAVLLAMCLFAAGAMAKGLDDLIPPGESDTAMVLLDPAELLSGSAGTVKRENYDYAHDFICTVYTYPIPQDMEEFLLEYGFQLRKLGFDWKSGKVDGRDGYYITADNGKYAMLVPYFNQEMLLLVQNGLPFGKVQRQNYMSVIYNGNEYSMDLAAHAELTGSGYNLSFYEPNGRYFDSFAIYLPPYADVGDEFYVSGTKVIDGFSAMVKRSSSYDQLVSDVIKAGKWRYDSIEGDDYFRVTITEKTITSKGVRISGTFEGRFVDYNNSIGREPYYFENGEFSATVRSVD